MRTRKTIFPIGKFILNQVALSVAGAIYIRRPVHAAPGQQSGGLWLSLGDFSTGWAVIETILPYFPLDRVGCRFQ
jgi:hypothetical protein